MNTEAVLLVRKISRAKSQ